MTMYSGFTYVTQEKVLEVGGLELTKNDHHTITWQPIAGLAAMVIGGVVLVFGRKNTIAL